MTATVQLDMGLVQHTFQNQLRRFFKTKNLTKGLKTQTEDDSQLFDGAKNSTLNEHNNRGEVVLDEEINSDEIFDSDENQEKEDGGEEEDGGDVLSDDPENTNNELA